MSVSQYAANASPTALSLNNETFLSSPNAAGAYVLIVDKNAMAAGDVLEIRGYKMAATGLTSRVVWVQTFYGAQATDDKMFASADKVIYNDLTDTNAVRFSLTQTAGTGRAYPWTVLEVAGFIQGDADKVWTSAARTLTETIQLKKNTAFSNFVFPMYGTGTRTPKTGLTVTTRVRIDSAAFASTTNTASEVATTGYYSINFEAADLNGNAIFFEASAAGCEPTAILIITQPNS